MATLYKYVTGGREVTYLDAEDQYTPEDIRKHWAGTFPELGNATTSADEKKQTVGHEGAEVEVDKVVTFEKRVGTKGSDGVLLLWQVRGLVDGLHVFPVWVDENIRAESAAMANAGVLNRLEIYEQAVVTWHDEPEVELIPEDQAMRLYGAAMLPGLAEVFGG